MTSQTSCVAMLLAGGEGRRLGDLTKKLAKPAVEFGGKYRLIDFPLSNCSHSGIDVVGVLTQYEPFVLHSYIGNGSEWDMNRKAGGVTLLPPFAEKDGLHWYTGTANAIYHNIHFIDHYNPEYVLILSGDHVYKMDYSLMLESHKQKQADVTISVIEVPWDEANRFGIMHTDEEDLIYEFEEKPTNPKSNLASMGIYIFNWSLLKDYLLQDSKLAHSSHDFGKDIIPNLLKDHKKLYAYPFKGYWKDVGTITSLWEANMDLLENAPKLNLHDRDWKIYSVNTNYPPQYIAPEADIKCSILNEGCTIYGNVEHSVLFANVSVGRGSVIKDSIIMAGVTIGENVRIERAIIHHNTIIRNGSIIGSDNPMSDIILAGNEDQEDTDHEDRDHDKQLTQ